MQSDFRGANQQAFPVDPQARQKAGPSAGFQADDFEHLREMNLDQLLGLASRYHLGGLHLSDQAVSDLISALKNKAREELDEGDGKRLETVRVEKQLGGRVVVFFGL